jgi:hypothetical protein
MINPAEDAEIAEKNYEIRMRPKQYVFLDYNSFFFASYASSAGIGFG